MESQRNTSKGVMGRPKIDCNLDDIVNAYKRYGSVAKAANALGMSITTFHRRLVESGVERCRWQKPDWFNN